MNADKNALYAKHTVPELTTVCYCLSRINIPSVYGFAWNSRVDGKGVFPIIVTFEALAPLGALPTIIADSRVRLSSP